MHTDLIVTITCPDRPGIVERVTAVVVGFNANWEESRMARLGGDFAGIIKICVEQAHAESLADALRALTNDELTVSVKILQPATEAPPRLARMCELRLAGADHEGIVHKLARHLATLGINVESMETEVLPAPMSAIPLFHMTAQMSLPADVNIAEFEAGLDRIAEELSVDIELSVLDPT